MPTATIRLATDADNDRILELARRCPQEGMISFYPNRTPRFNTLHRLMDPGAWHFVACDGDRIVGLVGTIHFQARFLGEVRPVGYVMDLRVDPDYRSGTTSYRLVKTAVDHLLDSGVNTVLVNFLKANARPLVFTGGRAGIPPSLYLGDNRVFNIIPIRFLPTDERFAISQADEHDIPAILKLYHKYASAFKIAPEITEERFRILTTQIEGLSLDRFLVAREAGRVRAVTALWDEGLYKSYQVLKLNNSISIVSGILKFLGLFMKVPHPVKINEPLRERSLVMYAHDDCPEALGALFRHANNISLGGDVTLISLYLQENDPLFGQMKGFPGINVKSEMHLYCTDAHIIEGATTDPRGVWLDLVMTM